jgi:hypothetical protein
VELRESIPPIWRRLELASDLTLTELHGVIQASFEWQESHLHKFSRRGRSGNKVERFLTEFDREEGDRGISEGDVRIGLVLAKPGDELSYLYDFGDSWEHLVLLEATKPRTPETPEVVCVDGARAGPPDDCGGIWGYHFILDAGLDSDHPDHEEAREMLELTFGDDPFDPELFDIDEVNSRLAIAMANDYQIWWPTEKGW